MKKHRYKKGEHRAVVARRAFCAEAGRCMACGGTSLPLTVHEIARGPSRGRSFGARIAWLAVCWPCNQELANPLVWCLPRQLALKAVADPCHYDLIQFNRLRVFGGDPERGDLAITQDEVDVYLDTVFVTYSNSEG